MRLLLAEDERDLAEALQAFLSYHNYIVDVVHDGEEALDFGRSDVYDALILDIMMPKRSGLDVVRTLRNEGVETPVMMLTAKGRTSDRIEGFDAGADDYLPKPFAPEELLARLRAMLRRQTSYQPPTLTACDLTLDVERTALSCRDKSVQLPRREFQILELLMRNPQRTFSAEEMIERLWGWDAEIEVNVVWVHISHLRKTLSELGSTVTIKAQRGLGYRLVTVDEREKPQTRESDV